MADNIILAFPNRADECTLSGGAWSATLPLANLKNRLISKVARSSDAALASTKFDAALTKTRGVRVAGLINHNLSLDALVRLRGGDDPTFAVVAYDSGWVEAWPAIYPSATMEWEDDNWWTGKLSEEDRAGYTATHLFILPAIKLGRYWRVEIDDAANAAGYVQIGRLFLAAQWQPAWNHSYRDSIQFEDKSPVEEAIGGAEYFDKRTKYRVTRCSLDWLSDDEGYARALEMQRRQGITEEVLLIYNPADTVHRIRHSYLGRLRGLSPIEHPYYNVRKLPVEIKEIVA